MIRIIGLALLWAFMTVDVIALHKTDIDMNTAAFFLGIRTIPLIMVTMGE